MNAAAADAITALVAALTRDGDIDLLIETRAPIGVWQQAQLLAALEHELGLPCDLLLHASDEPEKSIHRIARLSGITLS